MNYRLVPAVELLKARKRLYELTCRYVFSVEIECAWFGFNQSHSVPQKRLVARGILQTARAVETLCAGCTFSFVGQ